MKYRDEHADAGAEFENVHPTSTARTGAVPQADPARLARDQSDVFRFYCRHCGYPIDVRRDAQGDGNGNIYTLNAEGAYDRSVGSGCPLCGSKNCL